MKLLIKPHYKKDSFFIDTNKAFTESFRYDEAYNNTFCFNAGFDLFLMDEYDEDNECYNKKDLVATVEAQFFKTDYINAYDIDIKELADTISSDTYKAILTLLSSNLLDEDRIVETPLVCYLSRLYISSQYRNKGIATYILNNLQEIFEYITSEASHIFITLPCPQEQDKEGRWNNTCNEEMLDNMIKILEKHGFKSIGEHGCYYKIY